MKTLLLLALTAVITTSGLLACTAATTYTIPPVSAAGVIPVKKTMRAFRSEQELTLYFRELTEKLRQRRADQESGKFALAPSGLLDAASPVKTESVTNTQHDGVDEGGIVKVHGDHLVVLRRGRLFTVAIGDGALNPISSVDAFGPDIDPSGNWYDEMLISGNTVIVIGYSYGRDGTEVGLFEISSEGGLAYRSTYHLRSNDYYSSRNYASRLIGNKLIFYAPQHFYSDLEDPLQSFPAVRKWHKGATASEFQRILPATRVYRPELKLDFSYGSALHTVTVCDLANGGWSKRIARLG
jgi:Beta propeller domain